MAHAEQPPLRVEVLYCTGPGRIDQVSLQLPPGSSVSDALSASGLLQRHALTGGELRVGVWGRMQDTSVPLRDRDRVEIYRPLTVDPKEARRLRYKRTVRGNTSK